MEVWEGMAATKGLLDLGLHREVVLDQGHGDSATHHHWGLVHDPGKAEALYLHQEMDLE